MSPVSTFPRAIRIQPKLAEEMGEISMLVSTVVPVLQDSTLDIDIHFMIIISMISYWRWSPAPGTLDLNWRNWLEIHSLVLKSCLLATHQEKKQTPYFLLLPLHSSILLPK